MKLLCLTLLVAISLTPCVLGQKLRKLDLPPKCDGPNEHLVALGGGCFVDEKGVQKCNPAPPPSCKCVPGHERNAASQKCEPAPGAALRATRDTQAQEPKCGPNEFLLPVIGGCFINKEGKHDCSQRAPPVCMCEVGFQRNPATAKCEAASSSTTPAPTPNNQDPKCGPNESILPVLGGCFINEAGKQDCSQRQPPICVCDTGFERNPDNKMCYPVLPPPATRVTRDLQEQVPACNGPHEMLFITKGGCFIDANGNRDCSKRIPSTCGCEPGYKRNDASKKCEADPAAPGATRVTRDLQEKSPECGQNEVLIPVLGGCFINKEGKQDCSQRAKPTCQCEIGFQRNDTTKKCEKSVTAVRAGRAARSPRCKKCQSV